MVFLQLVQDSFELLAFRLQMLFIGHGFGRELIEFVWPEQAVSSGIPNSPSASRPR
jgi:hypothetical protein